MKTFFLFNLHLAFFSLSALASGAIVKTKVLVFGKTIRPAHVAIIPIAGAALADRLIKSGFNASFSQNTDLITKENLSAYRVLILLGVTESILNREQQKAVESFFNHGGGIVAIHGTISAGKDWKWFRDLIGTTFVDHAPMQLGTVKILESNDLANSSLPATWSQNDEWYNFSSEISPPAKVLQVVDHSLLKGDKTKGVRPVTWSQERGAGRFWYTALGHSAELYSAENGVFPTMLVQAIRWTSGKVD